MSKIRHVDYYPDEFMVGVVGLGPAEIGAYWIACSLMYSRGGPIIDDDAWIARACGCNPRTWRALKENLLVAGKLTVRDGFITNSRTIREIEKAQKRLKHSRNAAEASVNARRDGDENEAEVSNNNDLAEAPARIDHELSPTTNQPTTNHQPSAVAERQAFDAFVSAAQRHRWPVPRGLTPTRRKSVRARLREAGGLDGFIAALTNAEQSKFLREEMNGWSFDWFLKPANFVKVAEGNFNRGRPPPQPEVARPPMQI
jgi:uncharacterized protein YdaU (DUF1376 family)